MSFQQILNILVPVLIVGGPAISWVFKKLAEQAALKKAQQARKAREMEALRTGRTADGQPLSRTDQEGAPQASRVADRPQPRPAAQSPKVSRQEAAKQERTRAVTLRLTNALADITGRQVASDPWPFREDAEAVVDVRIERFVAEADGRFVAIGRYYVAHEDETRRDHAHGFEIVQPYAPGGGFPAIAEARDHVIAWLAQDIARRGLR